MPFRPFHPNTRGLRRTDAGAALSSTRKRCLQVALVLLLTGCVSSGIDRADRAATARVDQAAREARALAHETRAALDVSAAKIAADLAERVRAERERTVADVDARLTAQREAAAKDAKLLLDSVLAESAALRKESAAWRETAADGVSESRAWRDEVAAWRAEAAELRAAFTATPAPGPTPGPLDPTDRYALWAALAGAAFTVGKTGLRLWKSHKASA